MQIQLGDPILTSDGLEAGRVEKVIVNPDRRIVDSVVLRRGGGLFAKDVEVAVDKIVDDSAGNHRLALGSERLDELPPFDESQYTTPPADWVLPEDNPRATVLWPAGGMGILMPVEPAPAPFGGDRELAEEVVGNLYEQDLNNAVIQAGSAVMSRDDKKVGDLARLSFSEVDGRLTSLVIRRGLLGKDELELSGSLVDSAGDGVLYLNVDGALIEALAKSR